MNTMLRGTLESRLNRSSTGEELASVLRDMIMDGELRPGAPMREAALSERFAVSRRTVRDALTVLEHEGLVGHQRHRGSFVTRFDEGDIRDLYRVRRTMELAAAEAVAGSPKARRNALESALQRLSDATTLGRAREVVLCDLEFHQAVVGLLDSPRIDEFFATIAVEMRYALSILEAKQQESQHRPQAALAEHRAISDALLSNDTELARRLINEHADTYEALLLSGLTDDEADGTEGTDGR